ncbi:MAG: DDE-type integrase/transposase/recombinase [Ruminococcaceae bacterium]|nr:DDE-type integrase/transposase/recombinase [Oscillospiraceae bacterium]
MDHRWVTDISYIITEHGTLYLSAIRDLFDNFIISYKLSKRQNYDLVGQTIKSALDIEKPRGQIILHSDGGGQYRSFGHKEMLDKNGIGYFVSSHAFILPCLDFLCNFYFSNNA